MIKQWIIFSLSFVLLSCSNSKDKGAAISYVESQTAQLESNPGNVYAYAHPVDLKPESPLVIALDAQGDGRMALDHLLKSWRPSEAVFMASNVIRNGIPNYKELINELLKEAIDKFGVNSSEFYLVGFSGGARMAMEYSNDFPVKGLVVIGAGGEVPNSVPVYALVGRTDFNFIELYARPSMDILRNTKAITDVFDGKHEWADSTSMSEAMLYHFGGKEELKELAEERVGTLQKRADEFMVAGQGLKAWKCLEKAYKITADKDLRKMIAANAEDMLDNETYRRGVANLENYLRGELEYRQHLLQFSMDPTYDKWADEINYLNEKSMYSSNFLELDQSKRLKAFLGILFYSRLKVMILGNSSEEHIKRLIDAFAMVEPNNPDMLYYKAVYFTRIQEMDSASHYLALARQNGLKE